MNELISILREKNRPLEIEIPAMPAWNSFDELIDFLVKEYNAVALVKADGPDARRWILESNGSQIELVHDDLMGNKLVAPSVDSEELVLTIGRDLEQRLMGEILMIDADIQARILKTEEVVILTFWRDGQDLTRKIYEALQNQQSNLKDVQLFGAPCSYDLLMVPLESSDQLLKDVKLMDKSDLIQ